jgi:hypothetical protein
VCVCLYELQSNAARLSCHYLLTCLSPRLSSSYPFLAPTPLSPPLCCPQQPVTTVLYTSPFPFHRPPYPFRVYRASEITILRMSSLAFTTVAHRYFLYSTGYIHLISSISTLPRLFKTLSKSLTTLHHFLKNTTTNTSSSTHLQPPTTHLHASSGPYRPFPRTRHVCHRSLCLRPSCPTHHPTARL